MSNKADLTPAAIVAALGGNSENFVAAMTPGGIERQEAKGQQDFVAAETLPTDMGRSGTNPDVKSILESWGFKFLGLVPGDPIFQRVEFPSGWKKEATDHSMWSHLIDEKGRKRGAIFYKAAFYDRSAHLSLNRRFLILCDYDRLDKKHEIVMKVMDGDDVIFSTDVVSEPAERRWEVTDAQTSIAKQWLEERFPDFENPAAYWD